MKNSGVALVGIGNIMFKDEGVGHYLANYIQENYEAHDHLEILDGGVLGFSLMTIFQTYQNVILVTTSSKKSKIGSIFIEDGIECAMEQNKSRKTANESEVTMMLEICAFADDIAHISIISIIPEDIISVENGLTDAMMGSFSPLLETVLSELAKQNIILTPKTTQVPILQIVEQCANPTAQHFI